MKKVEILSPAKDFESLKFAILYGADAIYLGGEIFGMRAAAANFTDEILKKAVEFAHSKNVKVYLTCNTIPTNDEVEKIAKFLKRAEEIGVDALIVADIGIILEIKKLKIKIPLHISTQFGVMNYKTANALFELGAKRIVLARELSLKEIKTIRKNTPEELELECFVHGAMCMSVSGRCLISSYLTNRNANKGQCAQPCRWKYSLNEEKRPGEFYDVFEDEKGSYILNSKDLCLIEHLEELYLAGVTSFKIEGRAKSFYYVSVVTNAYKKAVEILKNSILNKTKYFVPENVKSELEKISHRKYTTGFLFGENKLNGQYYENGGYVRNYNVVAVVCSYDGELVLVKQKNKFIVGDLIEMLTPNGEILNFKITKILDESKNEINSAPNSEMMVYIPLKTNFEIVPGSLVRKN